MNPEPELPELRKGERATGLTPQKRRRLYWATAFVTLFLYFGITITILRDNNPSAVRVKETVYGNRPFGLPWQVVHFAAFAVLCAPFPVFVISAVRLSAAAKERGRSADGLVSFAWNYRALSADPETRRDARRVVFIALGYLLLFIGWLVFTSIKGI